MGRSGFCVAANLATRIAVIIYQSTMIPNTRKFIREIGLGEFVTSVRAVDIPLGEMTDKSKVLKERLIELGRMAAAQDDAEIIVPRGVTMVPNHCSAEELSREVGLPVIDCVAASVKTAEMLVSMGLRNSRKAYPAPPQ
jgi:allantoin racemase